MVRHRGPTLKFSMKSLLGKVCCDNQGWRIRGFEGARAPPRRQKHPLEFKEKLHKTLYNAKIQQKYDVRSSNQGKSMVRSKDS